MLVESYTYILTPIVIMIDHDVDVVAEGLGKKHNGFVHIMEQDWL
jgi:hypothetical protein